MAGDDVTIIITARNGDAVRAFRDTEGRLRDMRGRFVSEGAIMTRSMNQVTSAVGGLRGALIPLATAATPLAAALGPIAAKAAGAGTAVAAFGVAVAGQVSNLSDASKAQDKYSDAVQKYGRGSKQAAEAQRMLSATLATMPQSTARAAVAMGTLKDNFGAWSDEMAAFTMVPVEKSFTVLGQIIPRLTPMVKGASAELDRLVTVAGGAVAAPGFDAFADKISDFANSALKDAVDSMIHFARVLSEGDASGPVKTFMDFAAKNGPALRETLSNLGDAVTTLMQASAEAGPGMLTLVNAALKLVAAMPPELVATMMQTAVALKLVGLAGAGVGAAAGGVTRLRAALVSLSVASTAAGGGLAGLRAAFATLGTAAKASIIVAGIAAVAVAVSKLSNMGREAPPNVDRLTTSLGELGRAGKVSGESARLFGKDLDGLYDAVRSVSDPALVDDVQQGLVKVFSLGFADSTPVKEAKERLNGIDDALSNLVKGGKSDVAAAAFKRLSDEYVAGGGKLSDFTGQMDGYQSALADAKFEQELAADSMGVFGQAALDTSAKLDAQKGAADGLRQSILALNDANRSAYDAQIQFEAAIDDLSQSFKDNGATLDLNTEKGRSNAEAMSAAAKAHDEMLASGLAAGESLGSMTKKSDELRSSMMKLATDAFDGNKVKAQEYVNTLLGAPGEIKTLVKLEKDEAVTGLKSVQAEIDKTPTSSVVTVSTLNGAAIKALEAVGLKTKQLPDGRTQVFTANGQSLGAIGSVSKALSNLNGKTATTYTYHKIMTEYFTAKNPAQLAAAHGRASGGRVPRYATGNQVQFAPTGFISGPGTGTSDSILALFASGATGMVSDTEYVVNARQTKKYLPLLEAINKDQIKLPGFAKGGLTSGQLKGLSAPSDVADLKSTISDVRTRIKERTSGGTEARLLHTLDSYGKKLLANERSLTSVNTALKAAKDKLNDLKTASAQVAASVKSGIVGEGNITRAAGAEDSRVTINTILSQMRGSAANASEFDRALKGLKSRGLRSNLLQQIAEAGVNGGGLETAQALLGASSSQISNLNSLQGSLVTSAASAGRTTADALYATAIKKQTEAANKLQRSQDKLERTMASLANSLNKVLGKALGGKAAGGIVGAAASGGLRGGLTWVGEHEPELLDLPSGSRVWSGPDSRRMAAAPWASMLNAPRAAGSRGPVPAGGDMRPIVLHVSLAGREFGQIWVDVGRKEVSTRGGLTATLGS